MARIVDVPIRLLDLPETKAALLAAAVRHGELLAAIDIAREAITIALDPYKAPEQQARHLTAALAALDYATAEDDDMDGTG